MGRNLSIPAPLAKTDLQHEVLLRISTHPSTTLKLSRRARIILSGFEGKPYSVIASELDARVDTVKCWHNRWSALQGTLSELCGESEMEEGLRLFFKDLPRGGRPKKFTAAQEEQIVALACDSPGQHGVEMTDWSYEMLAETAKSKGIVESISPAQVGRILKNKPTPTA